jgi:hypothetical protein
MTFALALIKLVGWPLLGVWCKRFAEADYRERPPKPHGSCKSSPSLAHLLYALNVRPGMGVLAWKLPPKTIHLSVNGARLVVDGPAMYHLVNLFCVYKDAA